MDITIHQIRTFFILSVDISLTNFFIKKEKKIWSPTTVVSIGNAPSQFIYSFFISSFIEIKLKGLLTNSTTFEHKLLLKTSLEFDFFLLKVEKLT